MKVMKTKYLKLTVLPLIVAMAVACSKEAPAERPVTKIEFAFTSEGEEVDSLEFSSAPQSAEVGVSLNNKDLNWTVTSDKNWCTVENSSGRGSGNFKIVLSSNESFSPRDTATITFAAGEYTDSKTLTVTQLGTDFILSQGLFLSSRDGQAFKNITAKADTSAVLTVKCPEWITYTKTKETVSKSIRTTTFTLTTSANTAGARNDKVYFSKDGGVTGDASAYFYQFGNEMKYDEKGNMLMPAGKDSTFSFPVPNDILNLEAVDKGHSGKDYVSVAAKVSSEYTTVSVTFEDNLNDCMENRTASNMFLTLYNKARAIIPTLFQPYESCYGINTAKGFYNFAKTVNEGGDISPWMKDGVVHILTGIDMTSVAKSWPGIGNAEHPFTGKFDGGYFPLSSFASQNPVFGVCDGANISGITLDESNKFLFNEDPSVETGVALAAVAGKIRNTVLKNCTSSAAVTLGKSVPGENILIHVAGIVGSADASSSIESCTNNGKITASSSLETTSTDTLYVGGIAGYSHATIKKCVNTGAVSDGAVVYRHFVGGICGDSDNIIEECTQSGAITTSSDRINPRTEVTDQSRYFQVGGIAGCASANISSCTNSGKITNSSNVKIFEIGGIAGVVDKENLGLSNNSNKGAISSTAAARYVTVGGLYGTFAAQQTLTLPSNSETSTADISITEIESATMSLICAGGYVGAAKNVPVSIENAVWSHTIGVTLIKSAHSLAYLSLGGILGGSYNPTVADSKPADVTIKNCQCLNGQMNVNLSSSFAYGARLGSVAGIVGTVNGNATLTNCITTGDLFIGAGTSTACAKQNGYTSVVAGTVGCIINGNATVSNCSNNAGMRNWTYNNNAWSTTYTFSDSGLIISTVNVTAGILGTYLGPENAKGYKMEMKDCSNSGYVYSYRGVASGMAGYVRDAVVSSCDNTGSLGSGQRSYVGGIVGLGNNVGVNLCKAVCPLTGQSAGSEIYSAGGIIGIAQGTGTVSGCSYFGDITRNGATANPQEAYGAVIGNTIGSDTTDKPSYTISSSKWGGKLLNQITDPVELTTDNFKEFAVGKSTLSAGGATISDDCAWWDGK